MKWRHYLVLGFFLAGMAVIPTGCGSGSGGGSSKNATENTGNPGDSGNGGNINDGGEGGGAVVRFVPDNENPGPGSVAMKLNGGMSVGDQVAVDVQARQAEGVFGAAFDVTFDSNVLRFDGEVFGPFFQCDGASRCKVKLVPGNPAKLVVGASLSGSATSGGDGTVVTLKFTVLGEGESPLAFEGNHLMDLSLKPKPANWYGGLVSKG